MSCTRLSFTSQLLYIIKKPDINILNRTFIMRKKAIRITQFSRKSIIDIYLQTRPAWISFSKDHFGFLKSFLALLVTELHAICHFLLTGCIGDKIKMGIKFIFIKAIGNYNYQTHIRNKFIMYSCLSHA